MLTVKRHGIGHVTFGSETGNIIVGWGVFRNGELLLFRHWRWLAVRKARRLAAPGEEIKRYGVFGDEMKVF